MLDIFGRRYTIAETGVLEGFTDWHCHILPGVDDGVKTIDDSLEILDGYSRLGIREVWLTPHVMEDVPNTTAGLRERFAELQDRYSGGIRLRLAAEYMMDSLFESRLQAGDLLPLGSSGNHLLIETSYFNPPVRFTRTIKDILAAGYFPVLAHPERYIYMDMDDYSALTDAGIRLQLNLPSLAGSYGREARDKAAALLRKGLYDMAGTDLHRSGTLRALTSARHLTVRLYKALKQNNLTNYL